MKQTNLEAVRIADSFRKVSAQTYTGYELSLFDADFRVFSNGKYSRQHGMKLVQLLTVSDMQELQRFY